ncbi:N-acetylmuramoyl-L-alanine amidase [Natroniella acetigena]|uniref:N-acetylmuramoyl-L-alanine amidase family protein n=1 Tax=Natroniella acetigena TaxID=52004 RepID=UPI00200B283C|nr:N-acetylmuramoyl-L-alanine amidase [Natroniella acetigena]MCK8827399.1 N-acetylmuramoyl-L-alanine amidase [Natroniella acetigena]
MKDRIITTMPITSSNKPLQGRIIVVDPGHGGIDKGSSYENILEKDINLKVGFKLKELLTRQGARVIMTRQSDTALDHQNQTYSNRHKRDLQARVDIINQNQPDLFISLHVNYFGRKFRIRGPIVFYQDHKAENRVLADKLQTRLNSIEYEGIEMLNNPIRKGDYFILNNSKYPGVLVEMGFINKEIDRWLLTHQQFQKLLTQQIYRGILDYL